MILQDSKKQSTSLNNTATPTQTQIIVPPTNQANYLTPNKYASTGLALLAGILLKC